MKCNACGSERLQLIKVSAGYNNAMGWSPVSGEKDMFGNYKKLRPLLAHGCNDCGNVNWNIKIEKEIDPTENIQALDKLANEEAREETDPGEESTAYTFEDELG